MRGPGLCAAPPWEASGAGSGAAGREGRVPAARSRVSPGPGFKKGLPGGSRPSHPFHRKASGWVSAGPAAATGSELHPWPNCLVAGDISNLKPIWGPVLHPDLNSRDKCWSSLGQFRVFWMYFHCMAEATTPVSMLMHLERKRK